MFWAFIFGQDLVKFFKKNRSTSSVNTRIFLKKFSQRLAEDECSKREVIFETTLSPELFNIMNENNIFIGTSGWMYEHWQDVFYDRSLAKEKWLSYYARFLNTVEINTSFYGLPKLQTFEKWESKAPVNFLFAVKANRFITHVKKLKDPEESLEKFMENVKGLKEKLGPILFQLPPGWNSDYERLQNLLQILSAKYKAYEFAFEFRNQTWINEKIDELLQKHNAAFCIYDLAGYLTPLKVTANFVYIRLHGPADAYEGNYSLEILKHWKERIVNWTNQGKKVYCYFDNDQAGHAVQNALALRDVLESRATQQSNAVLETSIQEMKDKAGGLPKTNL